MGTVELFSGTESPVDGQAPAMPVSATFSLSRMVCTDNAGHRETFTYEPPIHLGQGDRYWAAVDGVVTIERDGAIGHEIRYAVERPGGGPAPVDVGRVPPMQPIEVHVHNHYGDDETKELLHKILRTVRGTDQEVNDLMIDVTQLQAAAAAEKTLDDSAIALLQNLSTQLADEPTAQAAIDDVVAQLQSSGANLGDAIVANTPAAPVAPPVDGDAPPAGDGDVPPPPEAEAAPAT